MNRSAKRLRLFENDGDYQTFLACLIGGLDRVPIRLLAYCIMPNHFHLVVWPAEPGEISRFMHVVTATHGRRWHRARGSEGTGCVYQGRYRAVVVRSDVQFHAVCRYVESNALRARLVTRAEDWPWSSLYQRCKNYYPVPLQAWPIPQPSNWIELVNRPIADQDTKTLRASIGPRPIGRPRIAKKVIG